MKCSVCGSTDVKKVKESGVVDGLKEGSLGAGAGAAFASLIPIPIVSTAAGAIVGGIAGAACGIRDHFFCNKCGSSFKEWNF